MRTDFCPQHRTVRAKRGTRSSLSSNPFTLDSKEPDWSKFQDYLKGEVRFASVMKQYPAEAAELFQAAEDNAKWRLRSYKRMAAQSWDVEA